MRRILPLLLCVSLASVAVAKTPERISVTVTGPSATRDLEDAIGKELPGSRIDPAAPARVIVAVADDTARVAYTDSDGKLLERTIRLPADPAGARAAIVHLVGNLVRDQAGDMEASLRPKREDPTPATHEPPVAPPAPSALAPSSPSAPGAEAPPVAACEAGRFSWVAGELWPGVSAPRNAQGEDAARGLTLGLVSGHRGHIRGAEVTLLGGVGLRSVCGVQWGGIFAIGSGPIVGYQAAGVYASAGDLRGLQMAPVAVAQGARGLQAGVVTWVRGEAMGVQMGVVTHADRAAGVTAGVVNLGREHAGAQIGALNVVRKATFQLGVVNVAEESDVPLGLVNVIRKGRLTLDAFALDYPGAAVGVTHGGKYAHAVYAVGARRAPGGESRAVLIAGMGGHLPIGRTFLDLDALLHFLPGPSFEHNAEAYQLRILFGGEVRSGLALFGGPTGTLSHAVAAADERFGGLGGTTRLGAAGGHVFRAWPGATLGMRWGKL